MNLASIVEQNAVARPQHAAVVEMGGTRVPYATFAEWIRRIAGGLTEMGVTPGQRIGVMLHDHGAHLATLFAVARVGGVIIPMDHRWTDAERANVASEFRVEAVVMEAKEQPPEGVSAISLADLLAARPVSTPPVEEADDLPVAVALSSGTTGKPAGAVVTQRQMYERFVNQWVTLGYNRFDIYLSATPIYFGAGRSFCMGFLAAGATVALFPPPYQPEELVEAMAKSRATVSFLVPTMMRRLLGVQSEEEPLLPGLRLLVSSGALIHPEERPELLRRLTPNLLEYYASSEGGGISVLPPAEQLKHPDSVGYPAFRVEIGVVDDDGQPVGRGEAGRLRYRGPGVTREIVEEGEAVTLPDGWFYPGDVASIDENGLVRLLGRVKDVIVRAGVNVYPAEVERVLTGHADVAEASVFGFASREMGEDIAAAVVVSRNVKETELDTLCRHRLAPYKVPRRFLFLDELPKNSSGKVRKERLREMLDGA